MKVKSILCLRISHIQSQIKILKKWFCRKKSKGSKEIRRMVCDCTTSKEERSFGIQACGEDCLNRMLMIEWYVY